MPYSYDAAAVLTRLDKLRPNKEEKIVNGTLLFIFLNDKISTEITNDKTLDDIKTRIREEDGVIRVEVISREDLEGDNRDKDTNRDGS